MIVSHQHKFIFFAVPRTATHAVRTALTSILGPDDWQQQQLFGQTFLPIPELASIGHGHITVSQAKAFLPEDVWRTYVKFAFVRNPFDRFVSVCSFLNRDNADYTHNPRQWMKHALNRPQFLQRVLVRAQSDMLVDDQEDEVLTVLGRYETLQSSFDKVCETIGVPTMILSRRNASTHDHYRSYFDDELEQQVRQLYCQDFKLFDYTDTIL